MPTVIHKLFNTFSVAPSGRSTLTPAARSYAANGSGSCQLSERAVDQGLVQRYGAIDPSEGGNTARHQVYAKRSPTSARIALICSPTSDSTWTIPSMAIRSAAGSADFLLFDR